MLRISLASFLSHFSDFSQARVSAFEGSCDFTGFGSGLIQDTVHYILICVQFLGFAIVGAGISSSVHL